MTVTELQVGTETVARTDPAIEALKGLLKDQFAVRTEAEVFNHTLGTSTEMKYGVFLPPDGSAIKPLYYQVGNERFMQHDVFDRLPPEVRARLDVTTILHMRDIGYEPERRYNATTLTALQALDLRGAHVADLGSGNGTTTFAALREGAERVIAVEADANYASALGHDLRRQSSQALKGADQKVKIVHSKFKPFRMPFATPYIHSALQKGEVTHVIAAIGRHYGDADMQAYSLLDQMPKAKVVLASGYFRGEPDNLSDDQARAELARRGFKVTDEFTLPMGKGEAMTFIARRS